jgi:hypothetical protein
MEKIRTYYFKKKENVVEVKHNLAYPKTTSIPERS